MADSKGIGPKQSSWDELELLDVTGRIEQIMNRCDLPVLKTTKLKSNMVPLNPKRENSLLMLLYDLNHFEPEFDVMSSFNQHQLWSLIATSGMGKTHTALSFLSENFGLYFSCAIPSDVNFGSSDMSYFLDRLAIDGRFSNDFKNNYKYVAIFMKCIVLARLKIFELLKVKYPKITPAQWLFFQLFPPKLSKIDYEDLLLGFNDVFCQVTVLLRSLSEKNQNLLVANTKISNNKIPVFLDEAQKLCHVYGSAFKFSKERPLYTAVCKGIIDSLHNEDISVCAIGTGLALDLVEELNSSFTFKAYEDSSEPNQRLTFNYSTRDEVFRYLSQFLSIPHDLEFICSWLVGRPRIASSFLQFIFERGLDEQSCMAYVLSQTTVMGGNSKSLYSDVMNLFSGRRTLYDKDHIMEISRELQIAVQRYMYTSKYYVTTNAHIFELGFGILKRKPIGKSSEAIDISEPLVMKALFNYFYADNMFDEIKKVPLNLMTLLSNSDSALGVIFELTVPSVTKKLLAMDDVVRLAAFGDKLWRQPFLELKSSKDIILRPFIRKECQSYPLETHLVNPECDLLSLDENKGADFAGSIDNEMGVTIGMVSIQVKFRKNFNQKDALLKSAVLYFPSNGFNIRILLAYPKKTKFKLVTRLESVIVLIIDQRNAEHFFSSEELAAFDYYKKLYPTMDNLDSFEIYCESLGLKEESA